MIRESIAKLMDDQNLTRAEAESVMNEIMDGAATHAQMAAFLTALRLKGETVDEITGCAKVMRDKAVAVQPTRTDLVDQLSNSGFAGLDSTLNVHIRNLRLKIEEDPSNPHYVETVFGVGYRFQKVN